MPTYEYQCDYCKTVTELIRKPHRIPEKTRCKKPGCGRLARRILSKTAVKCDSINDVKWLPSSLKTLPDSAKNISSRAEHAQYLKDHGLICTG
jgi:putative FmdB family regulatory protein